MFSFLKPHLIVLGLAMNFNSYVIFPSHYSMNLSSSILVISSYETTYPSVMGRGVVEC